MELKHSEIRLSSGEYSVLDYAQLVELKHDGEPRAVVDAANRPAVNEKRQKARERLERFEWWRSEARFPLEPDEQRQLNALVGWFTGFGVTSAMLLAPAIACTSVLYWSRGAVSVVPTVGTAIAIISLMLLLLVMQRLTRPIWGKSGDPALVLRRPFVLLLPASVMATLWWSTYPTHSVRVVGLLFPLVYILILVALVAWFLVLYLRYADQQVVWDRLRNQEPRETLEAFYELMNPVRERERHWRRLETALQYLEPFLRSTYIVSSEPGQPGTWVGPLSDRPKSLREMGLELSKGLENLFSGDRLLALGLREIAILKPLENRELVLGCCAVTTRYTRGMLVGDSSARESSTDELEGHQYVSHKLRRTAQGWFLEDGVFHLISSKDAGQLRTAGLLP